jgi:hypothetical protein
MIIWFSDDPVTHFIMGDLITRQFEQLPFLKGSIEDKKLKE